MTNRKPVGWRREPMRHSLASRGIRTNPGEPVVVRDGVVYLESNGVLHSSGLDEGVLSCAPLTYEYAMGCDDPEVRDELLKLYAGGLRDWWKGRKAVKEAGERAEEEELKERTEARYEELLAEKEAGKEGIIESKPTKTKEDVQMEKEKAKMKAKESELRVKEEEKKLKAEKKETEKSKKTSMDSKIKRVTKSIPIPKIKSGVDTVPSPKSTDVNRSDIRGALTGNIVDVDKIANITDNEVRMIELYSSMMKDAKNLWSHSQRLERDYKIIANSNDKELRDEMATQREIFNRAWKNKNLKNPQVKQIYDSERRDMETDFALRKSENQATVDEFKNDIEYVQTRAKDFKQVALAVKDRGTAYV